MLYDKQLPSLKDKIIQQEEGRQKQKVKKKNGKFVEARKVKKSKKKEKYEKIKK